MTWGWICAVVLYALGALNMALLVVEWNYKFTLRTMSVIVIWPIAAMGGAIGALLGGDSP